MNWFVNEEYKLKLNSVVLQMVMCGYVWEVGDNLNYDISIICKFGLMLVTQCSKITKRKLIHKKFRVTCPFTTLPSIKTGWGVAMGRKEL